MSGLTDSVTTAVSAITAMGAFGTAAFGLVDVTKALGGGVSNFGFGDVSNALAPFKAQLLNASASWRATLRSNWINGVAKEDQKTAAKTLIRLGLSAANAAALAATCQVNPTALQAAMGNIESGTAISSEAAQLFGRVNAVIDAAMDAGFERGDQRYRNASKLAASLFAVILAVWAGYLLSGSSLAGSLGVVSSGGAGGLGVVSYLHSSLCGWALFVGMIAVPIAPVAKDIASSLQAAATAVSAVKR